jgi:hypothetical protein
MGEKTGKKLSIDLNGEKAKYGSSNTLIRETFNYNVLKKLYTGQNLLSHTKKIISNTILKITII